MFSETLSTVKVESFTGINFRERVGQKFGFVGINFPKWRKFWACFLIFVTYFAIFDWYFAPEIGSTILRGLSFAIDEKISEIAKFSTHETFYK